MDDPTPDPKSRTIALVASLAGLVVSAYLLKVHVELAAGGSVLCDVNEVLSCSSAATSTYARLLGVPIALLGAGWYVVALLLTVARRPGLLTLGYGAGAAYSIFLLVVSAVVLRTLCPACAVLYLCNFAGLGAALAWSRGLGGIFTAASRPGSARICATSGLVFALLVGIGTVALPSPAPAQPGESLSEELVALLGAEESPAIGPEGARITIVEFSDFQCPFCSRLAESMHRLLEEYPGDIRLEFRHFPLSFHVNARTAAEAAVCAQQQGKFWEMHDAMFANQASLSREGLMELAPNAGVDVDALAACLDAGEVGARVDSDQETGTALGVTGTPNFFVNGVNFAGALPYEELVAIVEAALAE